jgi:hypothetical protein
VPIDAAELVSTSNLARATLAREPELDEDAAILELIESGKKLHLALTDAVSDSDFWSELQTRSLGSVVAPTGQAENFAIFAAAQHVAVLEILGYQPPPPARDFVDEAVEALQVLRELSPEPSARSEQVVQAREALRVFSARLLQLLQERRVIPPVVRRSLLRRALGRGAKVALVLAPLALAYGAKFAVESFGIPGDAIKDAIQELAGAAAIMVASALPEAKVAEVETASILGEIDEKARVRALASVVQVRLLRLDVQSGLDDVTWAAIVAPIVQMDAVVRRRLSLTDEYSAQLDVFSSSVRALQEQPSEQNLAATVRAWMGVQASLDQMEANPSEFDTRIQELLLEQDRRAAAERAHEEESQRAAEEQARLEQEEQEEQERIAARAREEEERRRQQAAAEAQREQAQRGMTMEQGG